MQTHFKGMCETNRWALAFIDHFVYKGFDPAEYSSHFRVHFGESNHTKQKLVENIICSEISKKSLSSVKYNSTMVSKFVVTICILALVGLAMVSVVEGDCKCGPCIIPPLAPICPPKSQYIHWDGETIKECPHVTNVPGQCKWCCNVTANWIKVYRKLVR